MVNPKIKGTSMGKNMIDICNKPSPMGGLMIFWPPGEIPSDRAARALIQCPTMSHNSIVIF